MIRAFYTAGPGNAFTTFKDWAAGDTDLTTSHVAYSRQFYDVCQKKDASALITCSYSADSTNLKSGDLSIVFRPDLSAGKSGLSFYKAQFLKARRDMEDVHEFGANLVLLSEDANPVLYAPLFRKGIAVVQALHTRLWSEGSDVSPTRRLLLRLTGRIYADKMHAILSASDAVSENVIKITKDRAKPIIEFLPLYQTSHYSDLQDPNCNNATLEVIFIGRVERNKGAFDLVEVAKRLRHLGALVRFHICGTGSDLLPMRDMVTAAGLEEAFVFYGWCDRTKLREVLSNCQVSIVPTRREFNEGFNHVVVESILARRPPVASSVCPAVSYVPDAAVVVQADEVQGYVDALIDLARNREGLRSRVESCRHAGQPFLDSRYSFASALEEIFASIEKGRPVNGRLIPVPPT